MEGLVNTFPRQAFMKPFIFNPNTIHSNLPIVKPRYGCFEHELKLGSRISRTKCLRSRKEGFVESGANEQEEEDWNLEFLGLKLPRRRKGQQQSRLLQDTDGEMDWCLRATKVALKSIESRGLTRNLESLIKSQKKTKKKKKKKKKKNKLKTTEEDGELEAVSDLEEGDIELEHERDALDNDHRRRVIIVAGGVFEEKKQLTKELTNLGSPDCRGYFEITADMIMAMGKELSPSPLKPLNIATALHRIAKNMEKVSVMTTHRLAFARQKEMSMLVGLPMMALPACSAQGISKTPIFRGHCRRLEGISSTCQKWIELPRMLLMLPVLLLPCATLHLMSSLSQIASNLVRTFKEQELAKLLWAFASLYEPADSLLDALDNVFSDASQFECYINIDVEDSAGDEERGTGASADLDAAGGSDTPVLRFSRDQLGNIAWSYAVQGQLDRAFFFNTLLRRRYFLLEKTKRFNQKITSSFQKEVSRLLTSTGLHWVEKYPISGYALDAVVVDEKIALEIDGPTHFSRNTGMPLGHAMLKRRFIAASGWNVMPLSHQELRVTFRIMSCIKA
ncbi:hypothetical protein Tsubulata_036678, partial [Turnera subulata]